MQICIGGGGKCGYYLCVADARAYTHIHTKYVLYIFFIIYFFTVEK